MKIVILSVLVLILFVSILTMPKQAYGKTCAFSETSLTPSQFFLLSETAFMGKVSAIDNYTNHEWKVKFDVEKIWKGVSRPEMTITSNSLVGCGYSIVTGEKYLVYANGFPPHAEGAWVKPFAEAQNDIKLLDDPKFLAKSKIKEELNKKLKVAKHVITGMMVSKTSDIPFNSVGVDELNTILVVGIDSTKATLSEEEYQKRIKEIVGDIPIKIEFGQIVALVKNDTTKPLLSPLKQFKSGISAEKVQCKDGLLLVIKSSNGHPACVKPQSVEKLIERWWATTNRISELVNPQTYLITKDDKTFQIQYSLKGAKLSEIVNDDLSASIHVLLADAVGGELVISIPRGLIDAEIGKSAIDDVFFILIDGREYLYGEKSSEKERTLTILFPNGAHDIEIIGTNWT